MTNAAPTPHPTLYIKNIDWKVKKSLLQRALYSLFTRYGKVSSVIVSRRNGLRGQAFVVMGSTDAAAQALSNANGFSFFGKDLVVEYARQPTTNGVYQKKKESKSSEFGPDKSDGAAKGKRTLAEDEVSEAKRQKIEGVDNQ